MGVASPNAQKRDALIGRVINDRYRVVAPIARGGMGKVYRAEQLPLGRPIALKVLDPKHSTESDPEFHKRFLLEAATVARLSHPNTVTFFDYGHSPDGVYFIAMELVEGRTLAAVLKNEKCLEPRRALHVTAQICRSLREAHGLGVIHRDLKPANVVLTRHGDEEDFVKVLDFGLVKDVLSENEEELTQAGVFMGSPKYMSPEQIQATEIDPRADIYSLGVLLYQMLTGSVPFDGGSPVFTMLAHIQESVPPMRRPGGSPIPAVVEQIVLRCLEKDRDARWASMNELLVALKEAGASLGMAEMGKPTGTFAAAGPAGTDTFEGTPSAGFSQTRPVSASESPTGEAGDSPAPSAAAEPAAEPAADSERPAEAGAEGREDSDHDVEVEFGDAPQPDDTELVMGLADEPALPARPRVALWLAIGALAMGGAAFAVVRYGGPADDGRLAAEATEDPGAPGSFEPAKVSLVLDTPPERAAADAPAEAPEAEAATSQGRGTDELVRRVRVVLRSAPSGAMVRIGERRYGPTPADVDLELSGEEASPGHELAFRFELPGHDPLVTTRALDQDRTVIRATLRRNAQHRTGSVGTAEPRRSSAATAEPRRSSADVADPGRSSAATPMAEPAAPPPSAPPAEAPEPGDEIPPSPF